MKKVVSYLIGVFILAFATLGVGASGIWLSEVLEAKKQDHVSGAIGEVEFVETNIAITDKVGFGNQVLTPKNDISASTNFKWVGEVADVQGILEIKNVKVMVGDIDISVLLDINITYNKMININEDVNVNFTLGINDNWTAVQYDRYKGEQFVLEYNIIVRAI